MLPLERLNTRWQECLGLLVPPVPDRFLIGVLPGEGVGPEIIGCALDVLTNVAMVRGLSFQIETGGVIGRSSEQVGGAVLSTEVIDFCRDVFARRGAVLNGPGGGRYVYELRKHFDLFFKISPLLSGRYGAPGASRLRPEVTRGVDILITRENSGGIYQGEWSESAGPERIAKHHFAYRESEVRRFLNASAQLARSRRGELTVVWKESGIPSISGLWGDLAEEAALVHGVRFHMIDLDLIAYRLIQEPQTFDVIAAPNLFGDVLADLGATLLGARGVSFSGNFAGQSHAVYQTNHGSAYDLAGTDRANPCGQIFSAAMMLRESFGLFREAAAVEAAVRAAWADGYRTKDVAVPGCQVVGTREMGRRVVERVQKLLAQEHLAQEHLAAAGRRAA